MKNDAKMHPKRDPKYDQKLKISEKKVSKKRCKHLKQKKNDAKEFEKFLDHFGSIFGAGREDRGGRLQDISD